MADLLLQLVSLRHRAVQSQTAYEVQVGYPVRSALRSGIPGRVPLASRFLLLQPQLEYGRRPTFHQSMVSKTQEILVSGLCLVAGDQEPASVPTVRMTQS